MKTKYFVALVAVVLFATFLAIFSAAVPAGATPVNCYQANYAPDTVVKNGHAIDEQFGGHNDLFTRHQECPGEFSATEAPAKHNKDVQVNSTEAPTQVIPTAVPTELPTQVATEQPTETVTEAPTQAPTLEPTGTPSPEPTAAPTDCPLNTNRAGHTNHSCYHPDDNSGQRQNTVHPAPKAN